MADINRCLGGGVSVFVPNPDGTKREIVLSSLTSGIKGDFERWDEARQRQAALDDKGFIPEPDYLANLRATTRDIRVHKKYAWGGSGWKESIGEGPGFCKVIHMLLVEKQPEMKDWSPAQVEDLISLNADGFMLAVQDLIVADDPKLKAAPEK